MDRSRGTMAAAALSLFVFSPAVQSDNPPALTVTGASVAVSCAPDPKDPMRACIGDSITLTTSGSLDTYLQYAVDSKKVVTLFLNGNDTSIAPEKVDRGVTTLSFRLERNDSNKKIWADLVRDPFHNYTRRVAASIGIAGGVAQPAEQAATFTLVVSHWDWYATAWLLLLGALLVIFGFLVIKWDILRDGPKPAPFSLGRTQMAWWFFLIIISYVMIWLISGDRDTITSSLLALMGISAGTALGAVLIDSSTTSVSQAATDRLALQAAKQNAEQAVNTAQAAVTAAPADPVAQKVLADAQAANAVVDAKLAVVNKVINGIIHVPQSRKFVQDILSDSQGTAALHRFQIVVWTIVLGIIFVVSVLTDLSMPEFSATLLATMGISAGTYLGFKFPEK